MPGVIKLNGLLPAVFCGMETVAPISHSAIWLREEVRLERGCRLCIRSESGGGKSSLLSFIYGNRTDYVGRITFDDVDVRSFGIERWCALRTRELALLPQELRLFPELTVLQNIALKNDRTGCKSGEQIMTLLDRLGVADKRDVPAGRLSIGQQQRVALVRTLCQPFDFLFLDEPVSHLDARNNRLVADIVAEEAAARGAGIVTTSVGTPLLLDGAQTIDL